MSFVIQQQTGPVAPLTKIVRTLVVGFITICTSYAADSAPDSTTQQAMLETIRQYAGRYLDSLPNFVCARVTEQYEAGKKPAHWRQRETLTARLVFNQGKENQTLEAVNDKPVRPDRFVSRPLQTEGEFGILLSNVLDSDHVQITWNRWDELRGRRLAVFEYLIDQQHSTVSLGLGGLARQVVPYRGLFYADPASGEVWRITSSPFNIPESLSTKSLTTTVDYGPVDIASRHFFLPVAADVLLNTGEKHILHKIAFRDYRKFEAESKITFSNSSN
jgi:hypothetical protein